MSGFTPRLCVSASSHNSRFYYRHTQRPHILGQPLECRLVLVRADNSASRSGKVRRGARPPRRMYHLEVATVDLEDARAQVEISVDQLAQTRIITPQQAFPSLLR